MPLSAFLPCLDADAFRAGLQDAVFSARAARDEDERALAAEREELAAFCREYEAWLDGLRDTMPDPTPETLLSHAPPTSL